MRLPDPRDRPWLTVDEVAEITGEGSKAIRTAVAAGVLPKLSIGRYVRIPTAALYELCHISPDMREPETIAVSGIATILSPATDGGINDHGTAPPFDAA